MRICHLSSVSADLIWFWPIALSSFSGKFGQYMIITGKLHSLNYGNGNGNDAHKSEVTYCISTRYILASVLGNNRTTEGGVQQNKYQCIAMVS